MVARPPIEKWSRVELEDNYHAVLEQMRTYQKKNNELEKKITQLNSRFRRAVMERRPRGTESVERDKYEQLANENQLLGMKLKAVKHQLLTYTTPTARPATALAMTGRSTFRPPSTFRRFPPSSASVDELQSSRRTNRPNTSTGDYGPRTRPIRQENEDDQMTLPKTGGIVRIVDGSGSHQEKAMVIRLNRQMREKNIQLSSVQYELDTARTRIEELTEELARKRTEFAELFEKKTEETGAKESWMETEMIRRELAQAKEELRLMNAANERLVRQSLTHEMEGNESEIVELKRNVVELEERLKETEKRAREAERKARQERRQLQGWRKREKKRSTAGEQTVTQSRPIAVREISEEEEYRPATKHRKNKEVDEVLNKLYKDVNSLLESHEAKNIDDVISLDLSESQKLAKWQKMYSELYEELEKVRNMLLLQHNINQKQSSEITLLHEECERLKEAGEQKLDELKRKLQEKQRHVDVLQQQIHDIAYSGQKPVILREIPVALSEQLSTRLSLKLTNIKFSNARGATSIFMSLEFFDFELQTTPVLRAIDQPLDFTTSYDVVVSNLLIHYLQTNGITIELYRAKSASYEFLGAGTVSLTELLGRRDDSLLGGHLALREMETGHVLATLSYELRTTKELSEALNAFRRAETAQKMLPIETKTLDQGWCELSVTVRKCTGLENISAEPMEVCLVYELLAFSPFATDNVIGTGTVDFRSDKKWPLPLDALQYFHDQEIGLYLMDRGESRTEEGILGMLSLPLSPLLANSMVKGNFPIIKADGSDLRVSLEVEIKWATPPVRREFPMEKPSKPERVFLPPSPSIPTAPHSPSRPLAQEVPSEEMPGETYVEEDIESVASSDRTSTEDTVREIVQGQPLVEEPDSPVEISSPKRSLSEESTDTFTKETRDGEIEEYEKEDSNSGYLANLPGLPPVAKPRFTRAHTSLDSDGHNGEDNREHLVGFSSPLHQSIPPSETSSVSSPRKEKPPVALPREGGRSAIKTVDRVEEEPEDEGDGGIVTISIVAIRNTAYSPLMERRFEGVNFFVDWKFLDFPDEECRVTESLPLSVVWNEPIVFDFTKEYHLSKRRAALLEQYIENQNHMEFCLVSDAGLNSEELAVASFEMTRIPPEEATLIPLLDVNGVRWADLEMLLAYSPGLFNSSYSE